jgi:hypothetical protein
MTENHPITPPPSELVLQWIGEHFDCTAGGELSDLEIFLTIRSAQWGADQELEACCEWLEEVDCDDPQETAQQLRVARRPKPPSLKEQALMHFELFAATFETSGGDSDLIRRALEQLDD